jgi:DNA primase
LQKSTREIIAQVLSACDIVEVIGACVELKPAGSGRFKARCPFHNEKTPSFTVSRERQQYYCFGCEKHGDAINFLCEFEGLTFAEALQKLADRVGIRLPAFSERDSKEDYLRAQLVEFGKFAASFFRGVLEDPLKGSMARQYLKTRQLQPETVKRFGLGYAPDGWSNLVDRARTAGFKDLVLEASGLAKRGDQGTLYDFFRNRLMVPIRDVSGNLVAFGGRDLGDGSPKYINSPENALYKKTRVLYGLFEAREVMRREKSVILVEGYFDLMQCVDAGVEHVVATCGTALTTDQANLIHRYVPEVVVVYDADAAGVRAALRGVGLLTNAGLTVRAMALPDGKDPDDYIRHHGADAFRALVDGALDFVTFYVRMSQDRLRTIEGRSAVAKEVFAILATLNDELRREEYLKRTARELQLHEWTCRTEFSKFLREQAARAPRPGILVVRSPSAIADDLDFIAALLASEALLRRAKEMLAAISLARGPLTEVILLLFKGAGPDAMQCLETEEARTLYAAGANRHDLSPEKMAEIVEKQVVRLKRTALQAEAERVQREIAEAERSIDQSRVLELLSQKAGINKEIEHVGVA